MSLLERLKSVLFKNRIWISFPKPFEGYFEMWWFPEDNIDRKRKGRGFWQMTGHIFANNIFLETVWSFGKYCEKGISNIWIVLDFRFREAYFTLYRFRPKRMRDDYRCAKIKS